MIKTNEHNVSFNDLTVDTAGLQALTHAGIKTATEIGVAVYHGKMRIIAEHGAVMMIQPYFR